MCHSVTYIECVAVRRLQARDWIPDDDHDLDIRVECVYPVEGVVLGDVAWGLLDGCLVGAGGRHHVAVPVTGEVVGAYMVGDIVRRYL